MKHIIFISMLAASSAGAFAQDDETRVMEMLMNAKFAGTCGALTQMLDFQKSTAMPGGEDFVVRFWQEETARLGMTPDQFAGRCKEVVTEYEEVIAAIDMVRTSNQIAPPAKQ